MTQQGFLKDIKVGPVAITGGSALILLGLASLAGALDWLSRQFGADPLPTAWKVVIGVALIVIGAIWFFMKGKKS